jgi:sec-independent protein translocase protein TatA
MPSLGPAEILVILVIALLVFGPNKMPDIARQVGKGMREFKRMQQHLSTELRDVVSEFDGSAEEATTAADTPVPSRGGDPVPMLPPKVDTEPAPPSTAPAPTTAGEAATTATTDAEPRDAGVRGQRVWRPPAPPTSA